MSDHRTAEIVKLVRKAGILRPRDLHAHGIPRLYLGIAVDQGAIMRVGRGLYVARGARPTEHHSLAQASKRVPKGVVCLLSALRFHDLTTQSPFEVWLAIGEKAHLPKLDNPPLRIVRFSPKTLAYGVQEHSIDGVVVRVFLPQKQLQIASGTGTRLDSTLRLKLFANANESAEQPRTTSGKRPKPAELRTLSPISGVSAVSREKPRNLAASVRQKLFNLSQQRHEDFGLVLTKYGLERFLYRLAQSKYRDQFILKGALLFELWTHRPYRPTRDLDLEAFGENSIARIKRLFAEIISQAVEDDGLVFDPQSLNIARIKEDQEYEGLRVNFVARLERAKIHMQVDVGFGDVIVPRPRNCISCDAGFPKRPSPGLPKETVIAEKLEALVKLGIANTRMKDFYDL